MGASLGRSSARPAQGISAGMMPPPPLVSALTSAMCIGITVWTYLSNGSITAALAVASFAVLSLQLLAVEKPRFSQMTSSVFGLFYCGARPPTTGALERLLSACWALTTPVTNVRWSVMHTPGRCLNAYRPCTCCHMLA